MTVSCLCTSNGEAFPGHDMLLKIGCKLGECRIVLCELGAKHRLQKLQLNFPSYFELWLLWFTLSCNCITIRRKPWTFL
ncbi:origin of replication complex subunit 1A-like [Prunus avium]|uniref:Origin of replication complex subunit 1A-like n=1 Tax=Prunus avium TaxID=42229 RepID=A0A6P5SE13_PRUAV|nr:origin of replication complex subunit 1A-like [Prunus avium]